MKTTIAAVLTLASAVHTSASSRPSTRGHKLVGEEIALSTDAPDKQPSEERCELDIARAFKIDAAEPDMIRAGIKIFDFSENEYDITHHPKAIETEKSFRTSEAASKATSFNFGVSGGYAGFSAGIALDTSSLNKSKKKYVRIEKTNGSRKDIVTMRTHTPHKYLLPEVKDFLLNRSPQAILDHIGPFYATQFSLGCKFTLSVVGEVTSDEQAQQFSTEVTFNFKKYVDLAVGGGRDTSEKNSCTDYTTTYATAGGNSFVWQSKTKEPSEMLEEWKATLTSDNAVPLEHKLSFIWDLLAHDDMDRAKGLELRTYIEGKWEAEARHVADEEKVLVPAPSKQKKVEGNVILRQPTEESGRYNDRSYTEQACRLVKGYSENGDGKWSLDQLRCDDNSQCLKYGSNSYVGRLTIPKGLRVTSFVDWEMNKPMNIYDATESIETDDFWNRDNNARAKGFKFEVLPGYTCNVKMSCV